MAMAIVSLTVVVLLIRSISIAWLRRAGTRYVHPSLPPTLARKDPHANPSSIQVYSCEYQLFVQQYFAICPSASEPIPFWPAPDNAPNRCSCDLGRVLQTTLSSRNDQVQCMRNVTDRISSDVTDLSNPSNGLDIAGRASDCACCGASASISAYVTSPTLTSAIYSFKTNSLQQRLRNLPTHKTNPSRRRPLANLLPIRPTKPLHLPPKLELGLAILRLQTGHRILPGPRLQRRRQVLQAGQFPKQRYLHAAECWRDCYRAA
jgi:hypothetical protein